MPAPSRSNRREAERKGRLAESFAAALLTVKGYRILAMRFRAEGGEIDIVARRRSELVFVEVKQRARVEDARLAVTLSNQKRIKAAAYAWLARHERRLDCPLRFDIVALAPGKWLHIQDAFR
ncbi:MAG: YraN family protein [Parvularcula sp.]|jgi:putative endonuclease|nr:YraN family protein [Parvularcula sp.]